MDDPFAAPTEMRDPVRRLRGRVAAAVTAWTTTRADGGPAGITMSSVLIAEGDPPTMIGLLDPLSEFWDALAESRRFVAQVLHEGQRRVAEQLAGRYAGPAARYDDIGFSDSRWGPVLDGTGTRAFCSLDKFDPVGESLLVTADIDEIEVDDEFGDPLVWFRGRYYGIRARRTR